MKLASFLPALVAICAVCAPISARADDKHDKHGRDDHRGDQHGRDDHRGDRRDDHRDHDRDRGHDRRGPNISIHSYRSFGYGYGGGYPYYNREPYYYSRPSIGFYYGGPATVYRGEPRYSSYADDLGADVQRELRRRGYYRGPVDGDIGPGSRSAIRAYQYDRGLPATGRIDTPLLRSLGID